MFIPELNHIIHHSANPTSYERSGEKRLGTNIIAILARFSRAGRRKIEGHVPIQAIGAASVAAGPHQVFGPLIVQSLWVECTGNS